MSLIKKKYIYDPPRRTMRDYYRMTDAWKSYLGFQPTNLLGFDIKNKVLVDLRENQFDVNVIRDPWEHFSHFFHTCLTSR